MHSTPNSAGSSLQNNPFRMSNSNHVLFNVLKNGSIQKYDYTDISYITKYTKHQMLKLNGKILNI